MNIILKLFVNTLVIMLVAYFLPGFLVPNLFTAFIVALVLGIINITLKPILLLVTLPINILTLGLFTFVINALMLMLVASIVKGFEISGFPTALLAALIISVVHFFIYSLDTPRKN